MIQTIWLHLEGRRYKMTVRWLLGDRFQMLTYVGRKTGRLREVVLEMVHHDRASGG